MTGGVLVFHDCTERRERRRRIEYISYHDQLTGLYNRRFFEEELKRLDTERNLPVSILYADINGLKTINDAFGHKSGDKLIKMVSTSIKTSCRTDKIIARIGGDEFVILLPKTNATDVEALAKRIALEVEKRK